ncbi:MAG: hypothetical protein ACR2PL_21485 [Dehalococcoidia bacterium]
MLGFFDHGLFELAVVAVAFLVGRRFVLRRTVAFLTGGLSILAPIILFFLAQDEVQTWLLATLLASSMLNIALIVELAGKRSFHTKSQEVAPLISAETSSE